jgi:D-tyrosyl-tRNA(Tyr) deacylase
MRVVVQRVKQARVTVDGREVGRIGHGLVLLVGFAQQETTDSLKWMADKCLHLRIFEDQDQKFNRSILDIHGDLLIVSQFTLYGNCRRGRRPSFTDAASPIEAESLYNQFVELVREYGLKTETGLFGERMLVEIGNQGPVTLIIDSPG